VKIVLCVIVAYPIDICPYFWYNECTGNKDSNKRGAAAMENPFTAEVMSLSDEMLARLSSACVRWDDGEDATALWREACAAEIRRRAAQAHRIITRSATEQDVALAADQIRTLAAGTTTAAARCGWQGPIMAAWKVVTDADMLLSQWIFASPAFSIEI
jgi:hypothetical protein